MIKVVKLTELDNTTNSSESLERSAGALVRSQAERGRMPDSQSREPDFESSFALLPFRSALSGSVDWIPFLPLQINLNVTLFLHTGMRRVARRSCRPSAARRTLRQ